MKAEELKSRLSEVLPGWVDSRVEAMLQANPQVNAVAGRYIKKGISNFLSRERDRIGKAVDTLILFVGDADGEVDISTLLDDLVSMVKGCKETALLDSGLLSVKAGGGNILKLETRSPLVTFLTGGTTALKLDENDIIGLRELISGEN